jgi:hemerythrin
MKPIEFTLDLLCGNEEIDNQHRTLFTKANELFLKSDEEESDTGEYVKMVEFLLAYLHYHLAAEETLMKSVGIDGKAHLAQHENLRKETRELYQAYKTSGTFDKGLKARLYFLIEFWLTNHIRYWDVMFAKEMQQKELDKSKHSSDLAMPQVEDLNGLWVDIDVTGDQALHLVGELMRYEVDARKSKSPNVYEA